MREKAWRKSEIARSACATMRVSRKISIYRAQRSQQGCSLSLGMLRLAEPPTGRARLRSSLKSPRNPITPFETSRVATLHPGLYKGLREDAECRRVRIARPFFIFSALVNLNGYNNNVSRGRAKGYRGDRKAPISNRPQNRRFCRARNPMGNDCIACGLCGDALR